MPKKSSTRAGVRGGFKMAQPLKINSKWRCGGFSAPHGGVEGKSEGRRRWSLALLLVLRQVAVECLLEVLETVHVTGPRLPGADAVILQHARHAVVADGFAVGELIPWPLLQLGKTASHRPRTNLGDSVSLEDPADVSQEFDGALLIVDRAS